MDSSKHRTQISLEQWQYLALMELSRRQRKSLSSIIRSLISEKLSDARVEREEDPIFGIIGLGHGGGGTIGRDHDSYIYGDRI